MLSTNRKDIKKEDIFQAERLLKKIENIYLTAACKDKLCGLVEKYFYDSYENCSPKYAKLIINHFESDLLLATCFCTKSDNLELSELKHDISSTFSMIIYKACDSRVSWWDKIFKEIELKINPIAKIKIKK